MLRFQANKLANYRPRQTALAAVIFTALLAPYSSAFLSAQSPLTPATYQLAVLQYRGGGDWYANPTALPNLVAFCNAEIGTDLHPETPYVEVGSAELFDYPFVHMTGHGNVVLSFSEAETLRAYLKGGGFLHISDNYGMDVYLQREMEKVFPELNWVELPFDHPVYAAPFAFPTGLPKVHEHDDLPPRGYGLIFEGRLVCFYDVECDLGDGWEDFQVHRDPESARRRALEMGANLVHFALSGGAIGKTD
jgi:hypothetical protein